MSETSTQQIGVNLRTAGQMVGFSPQHLRDEWRAGRLALRTSGSRYTVAVEELWRWYKALPPAIPRHKQNA